MEIVIIKGEDGPSSEYSNDKIASFLYQHLEQYGDEKKDILLAIEYIFTPNKGGQIFLGIEEEEIVGAVVLNHTGMTGYIPENILVYIAVDGTHRGKGFGVQLMQATIENAKGNIALHVEPENPAVNLYKKVGFSNKYLEMRLQK